MIDRALAIVSLAGLAAFLAVVVIYVPDVDLAIVTLLVLALAAYDFFASAFRNKRSGGSQDGRRDRPYQARTRPVSTWTKSERG
jgi:uncharacterized protein YqgC (DUF456 family)